MGAKASLLELRRTEQYLVHDAIAQGGMASVHVGVREGSLGFSRVVAVKRLHAPLASDARFVAMLVDEARIVARIRHLNVVPTLDVLEVGGEVFVIMEFVKGVSLAKLVDLSYEKRGLIPLPIVSSILGGALRGLHAAHEAADVDGSSLGIVHRDFSPQNVLVGVSGTARVIDFGVAHALGKTDPTQSGEFKGKLSYAAPEQLEDGEATRQTDVYAAGIVLWELITGCRLFKAETDLETYSKAVRAKVMRPEEMFASNARLRDERALADIAPIASVAMRALERDPTRRFATAEEMVVALEHACAPLRATEVGPWVQSLARTDLTEQESIVMRAEDEMARRRRLIHAGAVTATPEDGADPSRRPTLPARSLDVSLPPRTFVALALCAAAGAGLGATLFAALAR